MNHAHSWRKSLSEGKRACATPGAGEWGRAGRRCSSVNIFCGLPVQTINDVVSALDTIVQQAYDNASRIGYFAALYRRVTFAVRDGLAAGRFANGPLLEKLDVIFALRYLDALGTFQDGGRATHSWMLAFHGCNDPSLLILQQLLAGMNAHINLPRCCCRSDISRSSA
jgi:hypothetical protein